jgi:hypothetical protein
MPRFWLSDGYVGGGPITGPHPLYPHASPLREWGQVVYDADRTMKQHGILRVPDVDTMVKLLKRQPVTLYRSSINIQAVYAWAKQRGYVTPEQILEIRRYNYPDEMVEEPIRFQL